METIIRHVRVIESDERRVLEHAALRGRFRDVARRMREEIPQALERCLAELTAAALGWSAGDLRRKQKGK